MLKGHTTFCDVYLLIAYLYIMRPHELLWNNIVITHLLGTDTLSVSSLPPWSPTNNNYNVSYY